MAGDKLSCWSSLRCREWVSLSRLETSWCWTKEVDTRSLTCDMGCIELFYTSVRMYRNMYKANEKHNRWNVFLCWNNEDETQTVWADRISVLSKFVQKLHMVIKNVCFAQHAYMVHVPCSLAKYKTILVTLFKMIYIYYIHTFLYCIALLASF